MCFYLIYNFSHCVTLKIEISVIINVFYAYLIVNSEYILTIYYNVCDHRYTSVIFFQFDSSACIVKSYYNIVYIRFKHDVGITNCIWSIMFHLNLIFCNRLIHGSVKFCSKVCNMHLCITHKNLQVAIYFNFCYIKIAAICFSFYPNYHTTILESYKSSVSRIIIQSQLNLYLQCPSSVIKKKYLFIYYTIMIYNG